MTEESSHAITVAEDRNCFMIRLKWTSYKATSYAENNSDTVFLSSTNHDQGENP